MVAMERIVRPYVPIDTGPSKQTPKCRDPFANTVLRFQAPPGMTAYAKALKQTASGGGGGGGSPPKDPPKNPEQQEKSKNSAWSYSYKKYMTKKEKEIPKEKGKETPDQYIVTDKPDEKAAPPSAGAGGEGGGEPQGPPSPPPPDASDPSGGIPGHSPA